MATELENNIQKLQEKIYGVNFDISKSFLPDNEIAKNILLAKSPSMSKEDAEIMIDGKLGAAQSVVSGANISMSDAQIAKTKTAAFAKANNIYPLPKNNLYYTEVQQIKNEARISVMMLVKTQKELVQELVKASIQIGTSIAGAAVLISPLSFNVPGAISLVMLVIDAISKVIEKFMGVIQHTDGIQYLVLLLPKASYEVITAPINIAIKVLLSIFEAINALKSIVGGLSSSLQDATNPSNLSSQIASLEQQLATAKQELADLNKLKNPLFPAQGIVGTPKQISDKEKQIKELEDRLAKMKGGYSIPAMKNGEFDMSASDALSKIVPDINKATAANAEITNYLYDVYLPDGTLVTNLDEDALADIKSKYKVIFDTEHSV